MSLDLKRLARRRGVNLAVWPPRYDGMWVPAPDAEHWLSDVECADPVERDELILAKLRAQVRYVWERSPFYRRRWEAAGVSPATLEKLTDLTRFPVVHSADLRAAQAAAPPFGDYLCVAPEEVARVHRSGGTSGRPTVLAIGAADWERIGEAHARIMWGAGLRPEDRVLVCAPLGARLDAWGVVKGIERLGAMMLPCSAAGPDDIVTAVRWARELRPSAFHGTPSCALRFADIARRDGIDARGLGFRMLILSGEPGLGFAGTRRTIEKVFGAACIDTGSMACMSPWMTNAECRHRTGMHLWQDLVYTQVCDPETFEPVPFGAEGTPVYTHLERTSQPVIRLASGDRARWTDAPCPCGRTYPRLPEGLSGRIADVLRVRGRLIDPGAIEDVLRAHAGFGGEFRVIVPGQDPMDALLVRAEHAEDVADGDTLHGLGVDMADSLCARLGVPAIVTLVPEATLGRWPLETRRVIDDREIYGAIRSGAALSSSSRT